MKAYSMLIAPALMLGGIVLPGCASHNEGAEAVESSPSPYAGGNGAFGEDPVNPGEHAAEQFRHDAFGIGPPIKPAVQE